MSQSIRMKLRSLYKSHWTCCRTLTLTKRTECLGLYELYPTKIYQCTKMILICHIVGAKLGTCRNPESYPDLFSLCVYIYILLGNNHHILQFQMSLQANPKYFKPSQTQSPARFQFSIAAMINKCIAFVIDSQSQIVSTNTQQKLRPEGLKFLDLCQEICPHLTPLLQHGDSQVRRMVAEYLGEMTSAASRAEALRRSVATRHL